MIESGDDGLSALVAAGLRNVQESARGFLATAAVLPPAPNTFSQDAALQFGASDVAQLQNLCRLGLLSEYSAGRYSIPAPVCEVLKAEKPPRGILEKVVEYYAHYAEVFQNQVTAIQPEYQNIYSALRLARDLGDSPNRLCITTCLSGALELRGDYQKWSALLREALTGAEESDPALRAVATTHLARLELKSNNLRDAEAHAREVVDLDSADPVARADALITLGHVLLDKGELREARAALERAVALAQANEAAGAARQAIVILGAVLTRMGDYAAAISLTEPAMTDAQQAGDLAVFTSLATNLGVLYYHQKRYPEAIEADDRGLAIARQIGFREKEGALLQAKGGALIEVGEAKQALAELNEALAIFREIHHPWYIGITLKEQGEAYLKLGQLDESVRSFQLALTEGAGEAQDVRGYSYWGLARAFSARGDQSGAKRNAEDALKAFGPSHHRTPIVRDWLSSMKSAFETQELSG